MRLVFPIFETPLVFEENIVNTLVIENNKAFFEFVSELVERCNGADNTIGLYTSIEEINFTKIADVVTDVMSLDCNNKKVISRLYNKLGEIAVREENYTATLEIISRINEYLFNITQDLPCGVSFKEEVELNMLFKSVALKVESDSKQLLNRICDYIEVMIEFCNIELFVFVNLKSFLSREELEGLYQFVNYKKIKLLLVENVMRDKIDGENIKLIDNDLCEIS